MTCFNCKAKIKVVKSDDKKYKWMSKHPDNLCPKRFQIISYQNSKKLCMEDYNNHMKSFIFNV